MVHPTDLLRTNSSGDEGSFVAPVGDYRNDADCGCAILPCLSEKLNLEKYAKPAYFVAVLSLAGLFNGMVIKYFRGTSQIWSQHYNIAQDTIDWLIYINEVFVGIFALFVAYWGNRSHRPKWLGALTIYLGVACITLVIPEVYQPYNQNETDVNVVNGRVLCQISTSLGLTNLSLNINNEIVAFGILILYQATFALYTISFVTHGITYIDDNISPKSSPAYIALVFAAQSLGKQIGIYSGWMPYVFGTKSIFVSIVWLLAAIHIIILGWLLAMFPKIMPNTLLRKSVNSLLNIASGNTVIEPKQTVDGFFKSVWRILQNKVLLLNITIMVFMESAIINFDIKEKHFNQSKYHVSKYNDPSGYSDPALIQFSTNLLKHPLIALAYIVAGMVIAKMNPKPKYLVMWNIKVFVLVLLSFAGIRFFSCTSKLKNELSGKLTIPYCSWNCGCSLDGPFQPICLNGETHFSPCWAGCSSFDTSLKIYGNCTCGGTTAKTAAEGSCDAQNCSTLWALAQSHSIVSTALLATTFITTLIINLRCVASKDKALALGLFITFTSLIPYLPVLAIYNVLADEFCQMWGKKTCQFYSDQFAILVAVLTLCLKACAIFFSILLLIFIDKIDLYTNNHSRQESEVDINVLRRFAVTYNRNNNSNNEDEITTDPHQEVGETTALIHSPADILLRNKQLSDSKLDKIVDRSSKSDKINSHLSEGDLVPPLKSNLRLGKSESKTSNSNNSVLSTGSSLSAIANTVGDDHDSDFSTLQRPPKMRVLDRELQNDSEVSLGTPKPTRNEVSSNNIQETEF